jgi:peptidoglycan/LPS O-acetylase OafA/YrhL
MPQRHGLPYRPDIDGLRCLAILPVLFYHYDIAPFQGGYVGVDIFFVISGYLITSVIVSDLAQGRFSLAAFYEHRIRRILPAFFAVLTLTGIAAYRIFFPSDFQQMVESLISAVLFSSNFEFWREAGYFDRQAIAKPLLHTWSLGVEEQFYLLWPLLLLLFRNRAAGKVRWLVAGIFLLSLAASEWALRHHAEASFYLLPTRMWELMLGAMLAQNARLHALPHRPRECLGLLGLALIALAVFGYSDRMSFPGLAALLPCIGAACIVVSGMGSQTIVSRALGHRIPVFVGLISYSLYLWHWPIYVFANYVAVAPLTGPQKAVLIAASLAAAVLSWRFVERPFRKRPYTLSRRQVFSLAATSSATLLAVGLWLFFQHGFPARFSPQVLAALEASSGENPLRQKCFTATVQDVTTGHLCRIGDPTAPPDFILWGDSHALALMPAIAEAARRGGRAGFFAGRTGCPPLQGVGVRVTGQSDQDCPAFAEAVLHLAASGTFRDFVLAARWIGYADGRPFAYNQSYATTLNDDNSSGGSPSGNAHIFEQGLNRSLTRLGLYGRITLIGPVPELRWRAPEMVAKMLNLNRSADIGPSRAEFMDRQKVVLAFFAQLEHQHAALIVYPHTEMCHDRCQISRNGMPLYYDDNHLNEPGARQLVSLLAPVFALH